MGFLMFSRSPPEPAHSLWDLAVLPESWRLTSNELIQRAGGGGEEGSHSAPSVMVGIRM